MASAEIMFGLFYHPVDAGTVHGPVEPLNNTKLQVQLQSPRRVNRNQVGGRRLDMGQLTLLTLIPQP
jgi:hypothetical protein